MITLRNTASAFLTNDQDILLMKRSIAKKLNPGTWASIGGHIEPNEFDNPRTACLREIYEETGIEESNIKDLVLRYMIIRREEDKVGLQYVYFGTTDIRQLSDTDEGELFWISKDTIFEKELPIVTKSILSHYFEFEKKENDIFVGIVSIDNKHTYVKWNRLNDLEMLI